MQASELYSAAYDFAKDQSPGAPTVQVHQGGTSSGKTYAILQALFCLTAESQSKVITTVVGLDIPNLKAGALRDALNIYHDNESIKSSVRFYNKTDRIFYFHNGSEMEFKSYDNGLDARSGKRNYLFLNEANSIHWDIWNELFMRTKTNADGIGAKAFIDYNPNAGFWAHENLIGQPWVDFKLSDHRTNPFIDQGLRDKIERIKDRDVESWKVYARGLTGRIEGMIFSNWQLCNGIPEGAKFIAYGLDWGFTNDETGVIGVWKLNGELWVDEFIYETGLTNPDISKKLKAVGIDPKKEIIADSAEPKSIEELKRMGWDIKAALKGPDSVKASIDVLKRYKINVTRNSINLRHELERYTWKKERATGRTLPEPVDLFNHLIDPLRYVALNKLRVDNRRQATTSLPRLPVKPWAQSQLPPGML